MSVNQPLAKSAITTKAGGGNTTWRREPSSWGWREVSVIDEDLGRSGASSATRTGFKHLVAEVGLGHIGAIFAIEVSRLARNNRDWYQLLDLCGLMDTLIIDDEGVYNTRQPNDRLLLGLKGTMSEAELGWIRQRAQQGLLSKARRGELVLGLPVGYVKAPDGRIEKHPDSRTREAIELVFRKFAEVGSVRQVLLWFRQEKLALPSLERERGVGQPASWRLPVYDTIHKMLSNPIYAGAYAFGRTATRTRVVDGRAHNTRGHRRQREDWWIPSATRRCQRGSRDTSRPIARVGRHVARRAANCRCLRAIAQRFNTGTGARGAKAAIISKA